MTSRHSRTVAIEAGGALADNMNGRELLNQIQVKQPGLKALFMSGYTQDVIAHHGVLDPGVTLLEKPFAPDGLARKVREVLDAD